MKLQIDTEAKTIAFEETIELSELVKTVQQLFPNGEWKKYKLEPKVITHWQNPIVIDRYPVYPQFPYRPLDITYGTGTPNAPQLPATTFCVENKNVPGFRTENLMSFSNQ